MCLYFGIGSEKQEYLMIFTYRIALRIPIMGKIESLNVSNAASVLMYEVVRQRLK